MAEQKQEKEITKEEKNKKLLETLDKKIKDCENKIKDVEMNQDEKGYKLALVGKVPTKVCNEGGAIKRGDLLVSASIPGYAKKAGDNPKVGTVIGKALENSDSQKGTILVLVNLQ